MTDSDTTIEEQPPRVAPRTRVGLLTLAVVLAGVALSFTIDGFYVIDSADLVPLAALTGGFALCERLVFHVEARNEAVSYTPTDVTLAIGLIFVDPVGLVIARTLGAAFGSYFWRRPPWFKLAFNLSSFALETVVAIAIWRALFGPDPTASVWVWLGLLLILFVALLTGGLLVATAISCFEGGLRGRVLKEIANAPVFHLPGAVVAASIAVPMLFEPWLGIISLSPAPVVWSVVRTHGALLHRYTDLTSVHEFSREVGNEAEPVEIASKAVEQVAENLRAGSVTLRIWDSGGKPLDLSHGDPLSPMLLPSRPGDGDWAPVAESVEPIRFSDDEAGVSLTWAATVLGDTYDDALVCRLADDRGHLGLIVLRDRNGVSTLFDDDDANRLGAMVQQLVVALRKGQFHSQIQHEATHDRLTGLPNRAYFEAWIDQSLAMSGRQGSVLLVDLDRFKEINDTFGHHAGDQVLEAVSDRINACCDPNDLASRFGGDEFALFMPNANATQAAERAEVLSESLEAPFEIGAATVAIASSIGIATSPDHGHDPSTLIRRADIAMYDAKRRHVRSAIFSDDLEENDSVRLALLGDLRSALEDHTLDVHFQPKVSVETGEVIAAEALVRWNHPERGYISPEVFVSLAEQAGLIEELTRQVLAKSLESAAEWHRRGWLISVAVNVSAQSLLDEELEPLVAGELAQVGLDPACLTLEITESTMMGDPARTHRILRGLSDLGVRLSVDDFGTGFSSLVNLRHLPVSELKIDRSFVSEMMMESNDEVIVRSTIDLGHNLGLEVVAEGVENDSIRDRLAELGCDILQGYGISRPLPRDTFAHFVQEHRDAMAAPDDAALTVPDELEPDRFSAG